MTARQAFGLRVAAAPPIPGAPAPPGSRLPLVQIVSANGSRAPRGPSEPVWTTRIDGEPVRAAREPDGTLVIAFGTQGSFRVAPDAATITCQPWAGADPLRWRRFLLDTVLWCTAVLHGHVALHAGAAATAESGAVAIIAGTGGGKTSLTAELIRRGAQLVSDDILVLTSEDTVLAHPAPHVMNVDADHWLHVDRGALAPLPLRAVFVLDRLARRPAPAAEPVDRPLLALMAHTVAIPGLPPAHARRRFEVLGDLVASVPVWSIEAPATASPATLADVVDDVLSAQDRRAGSR